MKEYIALGTPLLNSIAVIYIITMVAVWFILEKANKPGWTILIPIYNVYVFQTVAQLKWWWFLFFLTSSIPIIGILTFLLWYFFTCKGIAKSFGKNNWFVIGLFFLFFIFYPILAIDKSEYKHQQLSK